MTDVPAAAGVVAFDVLRCPVAEYFRVSGLSELCRIAWRELDRSLAVLWGGRLERARTLAEGADRCDFRWIAPDLSRSGRPTRHHGRQVRPVAIQDAIDVSRSLSGRRAGPR